MRLRLMALALMMWAWHGLALSPQQEEQSRIRSTLFVPTPLPALDPQTHSRFEPAPGVTAERVTYGTQFGLRIPAILYLPNTPPQSPPGKIPALIIVNGHGGDKYSWYAFYAGLLYARAGAAVLTYDPIGEGERNIQRKSGTRAHDRLEPVPEIARRLAGLMMTDVMQAISYLAQRPEVDARRIGAMGYSMGSFVVGLTGAVEPRLRVCVLVGGGNLDGPGEYWDQSNKPMCQGLPYQSLMFLGDRAAALYALHAARGPTLIFNGLEDSVVQIPTHRELFFQDLERRTAKLSGGSGTLFEFGFEPGASHRPYFLTRPVARWLQRHLAFPNWTEAAIDALPETHVIEWAQAQGVAMDRLYASELLEGGTRALGKDVPGLSRADLSVFTPEAWASQKDRMILESWLKEAKARRTGDDSKSERQKFVRQTR